MSCEPQVPLSRLKAAEAALKLLRRVNRKAFAQLARHRRWGRLAVAAGLGLLLLGPSRLAVAPVLKPCEDVELADVVTDSTNDAGTALRPVAGQQKAKKVPPYCDPSYAVVVAGYCWLELKQAPPRCPAGSVPHESSCLAPVAEKAKVPASMGR